MRSWHLLHRRASQVCLERLQSEWTASHWELFTRVVPYGTMVLMETFTSSPILRLAGNVSMGEKNKRENVKLYIGRLPALLLLWYVSALSFQMEEYMHKRGLYLRYWRWAERTSCCTLRCCSSHPIYIHECCRKLGIWSAIWIIKMFLLYLIMRLRVSFHIAI